MIVQEFSGNGTWVLGVSARGKLFVDPEFGAGSLLSRKARLFEKEPWLVVREHDEHALHKYCCAQHMLGKGGLMKAKGLRKIA